MLLAFLLPPRLKEKDTLHLLSKSWKKKKSLTESKTESLIYREDWGWIHNHRLSTGFLHVLVKTLLNTIYQNHHTVKEFKSKCVSDAKKSQLFQIKSYETI